MRIKIPPYKEFGEYLVYPDGRVFAKKRGKYLKPGMGKDKDKYLHVKIPKRLKIHRLVAMLFLPNPNNYPEVNHKDGNKLNNHWRNLQWCTKLENMQHSHSMGLHPKGEKAGRAKLKGLHVKVIREAIDNKFSNVSIAKYFKIDPSTICDIKRGKSWASL